jgi:hypothetical protein
MEVMIKCVDDHSIQATSGEESQLDRSFGIQGYAQYRLVCVGFLIDLVNLVEDGIGLGYLF